MASRKPPPQDLGGDDASCEVLDLTEYARRRHWWHRAFGHPSEFVAEKYSVVTELAVGGVSGWCAGFLFRKVGKLAATAVEGGLLLLQIASHSGYAQIDWKRVENDGNQAKGRVTKRAENAAPAVHGVLEAAAAFMERNIMMSSGFVGGFLLGLAS